MMTMTPVAEKPAFLMDDFCDALRRSGLLEKDEIVDWQSRTPRGTDARVVAAQMVKAGVITKFQGNRLLEGKYRGFILGPYRILDLLSEGNKDAIYLAEHRDMNRRVAIKVVKQNIDQGTSTRERLKREAHITSRLDHRNIVKLYDFVEIDGQNYLVMEYITGKTLRQKVEETGPLPIAHALEYARQVAEGLQHAHSKGVIHRDIKPSSLIVDGQGLIKILDMGHCRFSDEQQMNITKMYDPTKIAGSVDYIAPEQAIGEKYDARCDLYSLGATLFTLITGRPPFEGTSYQILMAHQMEPVPMLKDYQKAATPALQGLVEKMMAKSPDQRYASATEVIKAIQRVQLGMANPARVPALPPKAPALPTPQKNKSANAPSSITIEIAPSSGISIEVPAETLTVNAPSMASSTIPVVRPAQKKRLVVASIVATLLVGSAIAYWKLFLSGK